MYYRELLVIIASVAETSAINMSLDVNISEPDEFNCVELHNCLKLVAEIYQIQRFTYHVDIVCGKSENYIANIFRVTFQETGSDRLLSVIVKTLINTIRQELFTELHKREVNAYRKVIDKFISLQNDISINERIVLPKCIFISNEKNNEVIILEDLQLDGFRIDSKLAKFENLEYSQVRLIITELAKFHGLSYVLEKKGPHLKTIKNDFEDLIYKDSFLNKTKLRNYVSDSFKTSLNLVTNRDVKMMMEAQKDGFLDVLRMYVKPNKYSVFCHGDCWLNNILFKKEDNKMKICFLDFQTLRYSDPVTDILFFLYLCTDSEFRSAHFEDLKTAYYDTLQSFLNLFGIEANTVYPKEQFENNVQEMMPFGLLIALLELRIVTTIPDDFTSKEDLLNIEENSTNLSRSQKLYESRVNDVIDESVNNGVLYRLLDLIK